MQRKVTYIAYQYLEEKKSKLKSVKGIIFEYWNMAQYLRQNDSELSTKERQFIFQCRSNDIDTRGNKKWKYEESHCISCNDKSQPETTYHIIECRTLINKNNKYTYIPAFSELYFGDSDEQIYVSRLV